MKTLPIFLAGFLLSVITLIGCDSALPEPATSRIRIFLTDAPRGEMVEANVLIERVELLGEGERVELLADDPQPFDLLTLQDGVTASLADVDVPDGTYHQVRIIVNEEATVVLDDGTVENLKVPGGTQTGIKLPLPALEINEDVIEITIDFDVSKSFVERGNSGKGYIFKPVLKPIALSINGEDIDLDDGES